MKILLKYTKITLSLMLVLFLMVQCEEDVELPKVEAGFTQTINEDTGTVAFINTSTKATKYLWDFGDGETSQEINPIKTYAPGTFIVSLTASNVAGSTAVFADTITVIIKEKISLPITFDNPNVDYEATVFNGASFAIIDNPSLTGSNNKATLVGEITNSGAAFEGLFFDLGFPVALATQKTIEVNFYSEVPISALLKLEEGTSGPIEATATHGGTGWELIDFNFTSSAQYSRLTLFVDGPGTTAGAFLIDDILQKETVITCTQETAENIDPAAGDINWTFKSNDVAHTFEAFGNTAGAIVANPEPTGINTSCNVEKFTKTAGCETFAGLGTALSTALDFAVITKKAFKMKVLAETQLTNVTLRLERLPFPDTEPSQDRVASITQLGVWQELTFDFSDVTSGTFKSMIIYFERNANCDGDVYYFDDIIQVQGASAGCTETNLKLPLNFDCSSIDYASKIVGNVAFTVIDNPEQSGINNSNTKVGRITNAGANWENAFFNLDNPVDFSSDKTIKLKLYSTQALPIKLKFEDGTAAPDEADANHGGSGWEELTFAFTASAVYNDMVIFVDGPGTAAGVFYVDDIAQIGGGGGTCPAPPAGELVSNGDFETGTVSCWTLFQNGGTAVLDNSINNGGVWSGKLATGGPSNPAFKQERIGTGSVQAGDVVRIRFDHRGTVVQPGAVFNVLLFGEGAAGSSFTHVFNPAPVLSANWTTFTGDFTIAPGTDVSGGISFLIEAVCGGDAGCSVSANIDNVSITLNP